MQDVDRNAVAARAGVDPTYVDTLAGLGILTRSDEGSFTEGAARATRVIRDLERSGLPLEMIGEAVRAGDLDFRMFDMANYDRFAALTAESFRQVAERSGVPLDLLLSVRQAIGFAIAEPDDLMRSDELELLPFLQSGIAGGFPPEAIERVLRVYGESLRRMVEAATEAWMTHVVQPLLASGVPIQEAFETGSSFGEENIATLDNAILAIHHGQQDHVWMAGISDWVEGALERAGLWTRVTRSPAICFLDLTGYTRLTEERGDRAAADLARSFSRLVERAAHERQGRVVKWLGDGVMLYFEQPANAFDWASQMVEDLPAAGLPDAHVGIDAGPVIVQDGDCFGRTVNIASRIAARAESGEILTTDRAFGIAIEQGGDLSATDVGSVELRGVASPVKLLRVGR